MYFLLLLFFFTKTCCKIDTCNASFFEGMFWNNLQSAYDTSKGHKVLEQNLCLSSLAFHKYRLLIFLEENCWKKTQIQPSSMIFSIFYISKEELGKGKPQFFQ